MKYRPDIDGLRALAIIPVIYSEWKGDSCFFQTDKIYNTLWWGDSFAAHYAPGIEVNADLVNSNILLYAASGCAPSLNYDPSFRPRCKSFSAQIDGIISTYKINAVVMTAGWVLALENGLSYEDVKYTVGLLREKGVKVVLIGRSPRF